MPPELLPESPLLCAPTVAVRLARFASTAEQAIFVGDADGRVEWVNPAGLSLCGRRSEELVGRRLELFPDDPEAQRAANEHIRTRFAAGERARLEASLPGRDGRPLWIDLQVTPIPAEGEAPPGWVAIASDISERKRAEAALTESEERYRSLVEESPEPVAVHSGGRVVYVNRAAVALLGATSPRAVLGRPVFDFLHPDYHRMASERILKMELVGDPAEPVVEKLLRLDGSPVDVELAATPIVWRGAPAIQLAGHVPSAPEPQPSRVPPRPRRPAMDFSSLVLELSPRIEDRIAPRAVVSFDLSGALVALPGDAAPLGELVCAVVAQAAAALPDGQGGLLLRTGVRDLAAAELVEFVPAECLQPGRFLVLEAVAQGGGLDGVMRARLFEASFAERFHGRGPGLAAALDIVRSHGGGLRIESERSGGLRISLALPAARPGAPRPRKAQRASSKGTSKRSA
jgi:PAS domain S-box-containing protein